MRAVVQRVSKASVEVDGFSVSVIEKGFLVLLCVMEDDTEKDSEYISRKIIGLRVFPDENGKMNQNIKQASGSILLISQFTLAGDVRKGNRPEFTTAKKPEEAMELLDSVVKRIKENDIVVKQGEFGAHMNVELINDGPVTILVDSKKVF